MKKEKDKKEKIKGGNMSQIVILKGTIIHTPTKDKFEYFENSYLVAMDNEIKGIYKELPEEYAKEEVKDYGNCLIMPGMCDMHVHAPQFVYRGLGLDLQLMQWLETYAFPTESRFSDMEYAKNYYEAFAEELAKNGTTRAVIFSTVHVPSTGLLMETLDKKRVGGYVGKVNMDTLCPDSLREDSEQSLADTKEWLLQWKDKLSLVKPAITPRFIPTCSTTVLKGLGEFVKEFDVPVHSHISEDIGEMDIVRGRYPEIPHDGGVYDQFGLLTNKTVMAHFIYPTTEEMELLKERGVTIAHCPQSNGNVAGGVPPIRKMLDMGMKVGLGSDIAGGYSVCLFRAMSEAVYLSKLKWLETGKEDMFLSVPESFYLGTKGGGQFFGKVGSFETGYELDALVIDDQSLGTKMDQLSVVERMERVIHIGDDRNIIARYVAGVQA